MDFKHLFACLSLGCITSIAIASELKSDEYVLFIPDIAYQTNDNKIAINIHAWIYEKERRLGMTSALAHYLGIDKNQLTPIEYERLYERSELFRVDSERNKTIKIQLTNQTIHQLPATDKDGRTSQVIYINPISAITNNHEITYQLYDSGSPAETDTGKSYFATQTGISVISDIDDTIKDSNVLDKQQLLINTFTKPFKPIADMRDWYQEMAKNTTTNIAFHYVSSSPIQLYPALEEFMSKAKFPHGSFHLRESTTWRSLIASGDDSLQHKTTAIEKLLAAYPKRQFVLIGDSGEADPEIYAQMMRNHPEQIICIAIRNVTNEDNQSTRYQQTFKGITKQKWRVFTNPNTVSKTCLKTQ